MTRSRSKKRKPSTSKRSNNAKERRERQNLATGLGIASVLATGGSFLFRHHLITQTGHFRVPVAVVLLLVLLLSLTSYALYDWYRQR
jgi:hypothetical protein